MAYPCRIIPRNVFDLATLSGSSTAAQLAGLKTDRRARIARWPATYSPHQIKGTWNGQGFMVGGISLDRFNLEPAALVRFRGWTSSDWTGSAVIDTGSVAPYNAAALGSFTWAVDALGTNIFDGYLGYKYWMKWFTRTEIASFQIDITDTTNSAGWIDLGRVVLGDYIETTYNASLGLSAGWRTTTEQQETDGGSLLSIARLPRRAMSGQLEFLNETERADLYEFTRYVEKRKSFLISVQSGEGAALERDMTIPRAKFVELPELSWTHAASHSMPFTLVEA